MPIFTDDTELSAQEFRDNIRWRLSFTPRRLPTDCDGCRAPFSAKHACQCNIGELINFRQNILAEDWGDICGKSQTPSDVSDKPRIHTGIQLTGTGEGSRQAREEATEKATQACITRGEDTVEGGPEGKHDHTDGTPGDDNQGVKGVIGLCKERQMTILGVRITNVTTKSYRDGSTDSNLQKGENLKKRNHLKACLEAPPKLHPPGLYFRGVHGEGNTSNSQMTGRDPQQEVGQVVLGGVWVFTSTPVANPGEIVLAPTKGGKGEERGIQRAQ